LLIFFIAGLLLILMLHGYLLRAVGNFLIVNPLSEKAEAVVVLSTGMAYYPRLMQAAALYRQGLVRKVVINGNRKSDALRDLETRGFVPCCPWFERAYRILELEQVPRTDLIAVSAEDAYDTVSEARLVGAALEQKGIGSIIVTTSKFHSRRALYIWQRLYADTFTYIGMSAAAQDPFNPHNWWRSGRQIKWVLSEYGAWLYLLYKGFDQPISGT